MADELRARFTACGQEQVFRFWDQLSEEQRTKLLAEAARVDLDAVARAWQQLQATPVVTAAPVPFPNIVDATSTNQSEAYRHAGLKLVAQGKAATILMAGGAGTRLGFAHPKGMYDIQLPSHRSLFEMQAERLLKVCADAAQQEGVSEVHVPYYVMTSDGTHEETVQFWRDHQYFGVPAADVFFFQQGMLPALSFEGKILLETSHSISWAANGNGGLYEALDVSGALADMQKRGVEYVEVFCVDNALVRVADPFMFGFCALNRSQCVNKTVEKVQPKEGVGLMCLRSANDTQVASVIEYSEMSAEMAALKDSNDSSKLAFRAANIAIHCLSLPFLQTCAARRNELPFHIAKKKIGVVTDDGASTVTPSAENGVKMEMFVFDVFPFAELQHTYAFQVRRDEEFSPVKNAPGAAACTAQTACQDVFALHARWLRAAGAVIDDNSQVELSAAISYAGEGMHAINGVAVKSPLFLRAL